MVTKKAIDSLIIKLNLPKKDEFSQDWEYEVSDSERLQEFIEFYQKNELTKDEKFTLMIIILESCDEAILKDELSEKIWSEVEEILINDKEIHEKTIDYWSWYDNENIEDCFYITPLVRKISEKIKH